MRKNYRKKKFNKKRKSTYKIFFLILVGMTVGFAAINTTLQLIGTLNISRTTWDIHFENPTKTGGVSATKEVALKENDNTTVEYQVKLTNPGDYYEFTVDAKNDGTIDGMITNIQNKVYENNTEVSLPAYLESTITYSDGKTIEPNHLLASSKKETYKVKVAYKTGLAADQLPDQEKTYNFRFTVTYMQADENATPVRASFDKSSWNDIVTAYNNGEISQLQQDMENGVTREVQLDLDNDGTAETTAHLRIANLSTPTECGTEEFSQTACGLVIEFADIITTHRMNPYTNGNTNGDGNKGGWEHSDMRAFLNNGKYLEGEEGAIDYTSTGIYSALPSELRNKIIETKVVSGHAGRDRTNFTTTDKIYLFSTKEVWGKEGTNRVINYDSAEAETRQLDYYKAKGVTTDNFSEAIKKNLSGANSVWWLRSAYSSSGDSFFLVVGNGRWSFYTSNGDTYYGGVAPAFRIG